MALPNYLTPKRKGWPHDKSWPQHGARVAYVGDGSAVAKHTYGTVRTVYEGGQIEVDFDCGTKLITRLDCVCKPEDITQRIHNPGPYMRGFQP